MFIWSSFFPLFLTSFAIANLDGAEVHWILKLGCHVWGTLDRRSPLLLIHSRPLETSRSILQGPSPYTRRKLKLSEFIGSFCFERPFFFIAIGAFVFVRFVHPVILFLRVALFCKVIFLSDMFFWITTGLKIASRIWLLSLCTEAPTSIQII